MNNIYNRDQYKNEDREDCFSACLSDNFGTGRFLNSAIFDTSNIGYSEVTLD